jgi:hypothetical protein
MNARLVAMHSCLKVCSIENHVDANFVAFRYLN